MSDEEADELQTWMKSNGVWHKELYNMLTEEDVETLSDFQYLPLLDVIYIIDDAKQTGFQYVTQLKNLHGGFPKNIKKRSTPIESEVIETKKEETNHENVIETKTEEKNDENTNNYNEIKTNKLNVKSNEVIETEKDKFMINVAKPSKNKSRKNSKKSNKSEKLNVKYIMKDAKDLKIECRPAMEAYLRLHGIWQIDLFDILTDEYGIYSSTQFEEYKKDIEWINEFIIKAKRCGMMSQQAHRLEIYFGLKKARKKQRIKSKSMMPIKKKKKKNNIRKIKPKSSLDLSADVIKSMDAKEKENMVREKMEPFMQKNGFWQKDLFLTLLQYDVFEPKDLNILSKSDRKEIIKVAKQSGTMGPKIKKFKAYFV